MKNGIKKIVCLISAAIFATGTLSGCGGTESSSSSDGATELKVMMSGSKPNHFDEVLEKFYEETKDTLNIKLNIEWSPQADHKEKLLLRMTGGEDYDLVFDAPFMNFRNLASSGTYAELDSYFNNPEYPGLQTMFSEDYLNANRVNGKLYCIPFTASYGQFTTDCVMLRGDLRKKYNLPEVKTREDYQLYLDTILANEPDVVPLCLNNSRAYYHLLDSDEMVYRHKKNMYLVSAGVLWEVAISDDNKTVLGASYYGDPDSYRTEFPEGYKSVDYSAFNLQREWSKYIEKDSINQKDSASVFYGGKTASILDSVSNFNSVEQKLKATIPEAELEVFPYYKPTQNLEEGGWATTYAAWNYLCIPQTSKKIDKTMEFINWLFEDRAHHDLFEYGIEGVHWNAVGEDSYEYAEGLSADNAYNFPGYEMTWVPQWVRTPADTPDFIKKYIEYDRADSTYVKNPLSGFTFNQDSVKTEIAKISTVFESVDLQTSHGMIDDPKAAWEAANEEARAQGLDTIREELLSQVQAFLDRTYGG